MSFEHLSQAERSRERVGGSTPLNTGGRWFESSARVILLAQRTRTGN